MQIPTLKQLKYLIALDEHRHFGKAAEASFISQSAFSIAIKELESILKVQLVERNKKNITVTNIGRAVIDQARICLNELDALTNIAANAQQPLSGKLTMGVIPTIAPFLLPPLIPESKKKFPNLDLFLREDKTSNLLEQLLAGELDLILLALPYPMSRVSVMPLFEDAFILACCKESKWFEGSERKVERLPDESILLLEDGHCLREHALGACHILQSDQVSRFSATSLQTLLQMVAADIGVTFVPTMASQALETAGLNLELHKMANDSYREIGLVWRKYSSRSEEFEMLGALIKSLQQKHGQQ